MGVRGGIRLPPNRKGFRMLIFAAVAVIVVPVAVGALVTLRLAIADL